MFSGSVAPLAPNLRKLHTIVLGSANTLRLKLVSRCCSPLWIPASLSSERGCVLLSASCECIQDKVFNTLSSILSCCQQDDWQGTWSTVSLKVAAQVPLSCPRLFTASPQGTLRAPPFCPLLHAVCSSQREGFAGFFPAAVILHLTFSLLIPVFLSANSFIPQDPDPTPILGKAFLAPHLLNQDSIVLSAFLLNLSLRVHARTQRPGRPQSSGRGDTVLKNLSSFPQKHFFCFDYLHMWSGIWNILTSPGERTSVCMWVHVYVYMHECLCVYVSACVVCVYVWEHLCVYMVCVCMC